jgi:SAM-dependent methyltransferase
MEYGEAYFDWQKNIGEFGAEADFFKVEDLFVDHDLAVLEFGCGGGYWLSKIKARKILGVEINPAARENCGHLGVPVVKELSEVEEKTFDVCFSHHALEHVRLPHETLCAIRSKLKPKGLLRLITPFDDSDTEYSPNDQNNHLYTWSIQNLGNLLKDAGFTVLDIHYLYHTWPSNYKDLFARSKGNFHKRAISTARKRSIRQVVATAQNA